jgi:flagellar basal body-associated protein FliL
MNLLIIIISVAIVAAVIMYSCFSNAEEIKEEEPKFQPRKVTYIPKKDVIDSMDKPKKKYYKKRNKKKKPTVADNATPVEKRPVGRPRKAE